jgi:hypothetical protein
MRGVARARGEVSDDHGEDGDTDEQVGAAGHVSTTADPSVEVHRFGRVLERSRGGPVRTAVLATMRIPAGTLRELMTAGGSTVGTQHGRAQQSLTSGCRPARPGT